VCDDEATSCASTTPTISAHLFIVGALEVRAFVWVEHDEVHHAVHIRQQVQQPPRIILCRSTADQCSERLRAWYGSTSGSTFSSSRASPSADQQQYKAEDEGMVWHHMCYSNAPYTGRSAAAVQHSLQWNSSAVVQECTFAQQCKGQVSRRVVCGNAMLRWSAA
jgi:hypothetical protein